MCRHRRRRSCLQPCGGGVGQPGLRCSQGLVRVRWCYRHRCARCPRHIAIGQHTALLADLIDHARIGLFVGFLDDLADLGIVPTADIRPGTALYACGRHRCRPGLVGDLGFAGHTDELFGGAYVNQRQHHFGSLSFRRQLASHAQGSDVDHRPHQAPRTPTIRRACADAHAAGIGILRHDIRHQHEVRATHLSTADVLVFLQVPAHGQLPLSLRSGESSATVKHRKTLGIVDKHAQHPGRCRQPIGRPDSHAVIRLDDAQTALRRLALIR